MLTADDLTAMRATVSGALPDSCVFSSSQTLAADDAGGWSSTEGSTTTVACRVDPVERVFRDVPIASKYVNEAEFVITMPYGTALDASDRITCAGKQYEVLGIIEHAAWSLDLRAACKRVE